MLQHLRNNIQELRPPPLTQDVWSDERIGRLKQAYRHPQIAVLKEARIVACTLVVSAEAEFCRHWSSAVSGSSAQPQSVVATHDEASCMNESEALAPLSKTTALDYGARVSALVMLGDVKQIGPSAIGGVENGSAVNVFLSQQGLSLMA